MTTFELIKATYTILPKKHQKQILWLILGMTLVIVFELALAGMISLMGVALAAPETLTSMPIIKDILPHIPFLQSMPPVVGMLTLTLTLIALAAIFKNAFTAIVTYQQLKLAQTVAWEIVSHIFKTFLHAPYLWYSSQNTAELQTHLTWREKIHGFFLMILTAISQSLIMICLLLGAFFISPLASLILFGICGLLAVLIYKFSRKRVYCLGQETAEIHTKAEKTSHLALQGMREVHIYQQKNTFHKQYTNFAAPYTQCYALQHTYPHMPLWTLETVGFLLLLCIVIILYWQGQSIALITGTLTLMAGISWRLLPAMNKLVHAILAMKSFFPYAEKLVLNYFSLESCDKKILQNPFTNTLTLENITFSYPQSTSNALENINITIKKGAMIGVVGLSGAGKSTLVSILTGLIPPTTGDFLIDGQKVIPTPGFLNLGYVPQNPYIMDASLAQNVAFSDWGKEIDEERVRQCCKLAAMNFVDTLPQNIHTMLGDRGTRLSGGQIQRVAIARALYTQPDILLFDEATSALDGATEAAIQETILRLRENLTIVMIAHRLSTVATCDHVYWLHDGKVRRACDSSQLLTEYEDFLNAKKVAHL